jgi:3-hydroxyisobutyrate dehydrogenase-like beta-hydroxyacid dehydrogenase
METIGFIGLGNMGAPMAERLRAAGYGLVVHDVRADVAQSWREKGAHAAATAAEVGDRADVVCVSLPTPDIVEAVVRDSIAKSRASYVIDLSTTGPQTAKRVAAHVAALGKHLIDAPVSGGVAGARAGTLAVMAAAPHDDLHRVAPILQTFGKVYHVGTQPGLGQTMKVVNNLMSAAALAISSEAVTLAVKAGLDAETVVAVCNAGSGRNSATLDKFPKQILPRTFDAGFSLGLMLKDVELCLKQAENLGLSLPAAEQVRAIWRSAVAELGADADFTKIILPVEARAGVVVEKRRE